MSTVLADTYTTKRTSSPRHDRCPSCGGDRLSPFYTAHDVPVHSVLLVRSREEAAAFPTGDVVLALCRDCGFVFNQAFDAGRMRYSEDYEETQGFSPTFNAFHRRLALDLIERFDLYNRDVVEIGCGKGEFLTLLCEIGNNRGVGFDPAYVPDRNTSPARDRMVFVRDLYDARYAGHGADFICCKMTLEHIERPADLLRTVRDSIGDREDVTVFFQIPDAARVLRDAAFWDVYYEHCSYFTPGSLARLFRQERFHVARLWTDYDDQYLMIEARPAGDVPLETPLPLEEPPEETEALVEAYAAQIEDVRSGWRRWLRAQQAAKRRVVLWGGGSKAVAFLTSLGLREEVAAVVDVNPFKRDTYLPGSAHHVVGPDDLPALRPDVVLLMNPIYRDEVRRDLSARGLHPHLCDTDRLPLDR